MRLVSYIALIAAGAIGSDKEADWLVAAAIVTGAVLVITVFVTKQRVAVGNWGSHIEPYAKLDMFLTVVGTFASIGALGLLVTALIV